MKYCLMVSDGQYIESNFTLIVINAHQAGNLDNLVVLKSNSSFHTKLDIEPNTVVILDKYKSFLNKSMELVKIDFEEIQENYLRYLNRHNMDGTENQNELSTVGVIDEIGKYNNQKNTIETANVNLTGKHKKSDWQKQEKIKTLISKISNMCFDTFDIIENKDEAGLITFLADNGIHTFQNTVKNIKDFLYPYGYTILHRNSEYVNKDLLNKTLELSDDIGKFWIIKDEDRYLKSANEWVKSSKPLKLYAAPGDVGYIIGNQGKNIKNIVKELNLKNKNWVVPYISVNRVDERHTNNSTVELEEDYYKLLKIIFKEKNK